VEIYSDTALAMEIPSNVEVPLPTSSRITRLFYQISFDKISDSIVTDRLRKTNIDEMTDSELRDFVKDLLKYV